VSALQPICVVRGMDIVYLIIAVLLGCAALCAIALVWPTREPKTREPIAPPDGTER
jgi:hypothetical protein